ncbi:secreted protein [Aspergillus arachidicola]|uniref:Secreted protein n=1 Tax=Aspergillus arachidicola TaxID=656916 RepID=A0A2G7FFA9_9EURO|nr:secreted protein [Aspergillus arachidicola]
MVDSFVFIFFGWFVMVQFTVLALLALPFVNAIPAPAPVPTPPGIPATTTAENELAGLTVAAQGSQDGYDRDLFPHWISQGHSCDTREVVLARDGEDVEKNDACSPTSGTWYSPYDGKTWTDKSDLDIDHVVPLSNAWKSGASDWTTDQRQAFANDLENPQLLAVTNSVNREKSDDGPEDWKPPLTSYYCTYAKMWVKVKSVYNLTITQDEKSALVDMLDSC